jgi:N-acetylglucosaminyldiphosphoundecaprenol N-acetyl-beta-D-mannosaminyltransferase
MGNRTGCSAPIAILGIPIDPLTVPKTVQLFEAMIASRRPHYVVTPNVDFLVQAQVDVELRRILCEADLVLCDGTPLVWASRLLGNRLPERVAGSDVVPLFINVAAEKGYRLFFLGSNPESAARAIDNLRARYPTLCIAGHYAPPFNRLLEMDHEEIKRRILAARPDVLFVCFGCPKQEKWMAMHYRSLGVPLAAGVGGTMDFLGGTLKRAPVWMRRSGTEWLFRLLQEPRRLFRRYSKDLWVFSTRLLLQWWKLQFSSNSATTGSDETRPLAERRPPVGLASSYQNDGCAVFICPDRLDLETVSNQPVTQAWLALNTETGSVKRHLLLVMSGVNFIDSTGIGLLLRLQKQAHANKKHVVLLAPSTAVQRALSVLHLGDLFPKALNVLAARHLLRHLAHEHSVPGLHSPATTLEPLAWQGEITAANAAQVWNCTQSRLAAVAPPHPWKIDLSAVRFIDSSGLGLMLRLKRFALEHHRNLSFLTPSPPVLNVLRLSNLDKHLLQKHD